MQLEANMFLTEKLEIPESASFKEVRQLLLDIGRLEKLWLETPLVPTMSVTVNMVEFIGPDGSHSDLVREYSFVIVRRYTLNDDVYLGGANGETFNATAFLKESFEQIETAMSERE